MPVQAISRTLFDQLHPRRRETTSWIQQEVEWFAERSRVLIGCISRNVHSHEWTFTVEGRDERGEFHAVESLDHIATIEDARALLEASVRKLFATGLKVFPRDRDRLKFA